MSPRKTSVLSEDEIATNHGDLYKSLIPLLRRQPGDLDAYLNTVACNVKIDNTQTQAHCYFISLDGNKRPRVNDFARFISNKITDFAIPRSEVLSALNEAHPLRARDDRAVHVH